MNKIVLLFFIYLSQWCMKGYVLVAMCSLVMEEHIVILPCDIIVLAINGLAKFVLHNPLTVI